MAELFLKITLILLMIGFFAGCGSPDSDTGLIEVDEDTGESYAIEAAALPSPIPITYYDLYIENNNRHQALYEPAQGKYTGAYILDDSNIYYEIEDFEKLMGSHNIYVCNLKVGDVFPLRWFLSCISSLKTPYIRIEPQNFYDPFNPEVISEIAEEIGKFYVPVFVDFYPNPDLSLYSPKEYIDFFKEASEIFKGKASNAALVFSIPIDSYESMLFYPGDESVDWVGFNISLPLLSQPENGVYYQDIYNDLDYMYQVYQDKKPLFISSLAVSYKSTNNHIYRTLEASEALEDIYEAVKKKYPQIKAVNYSNVNEYPNSVLHNESCSLTDDSALSQCYKGIIENGNFCNEIDYGGVEDDTSNTGQLIRSPIQAFSRENEIFISGDNLKDMNIPITKAFADRMVMENSKKYYPLSILSESGIKRVDIDYINQLIYVYNNTK